MTQPLRLDLLHHVNDIIRLVKPTHDALEKRDRDIANQLRRAMYSVGLNVSEAFGNAKGNRRVRLESALGSLYEVGAALAMTEAFGHAPASREATREIARLEARLGALVRRA